jgi:hypothetical protein
VLHAICHPSRLWSRALLAQSRWPSLYQPVLARVLSALPPSERVVMNLSDGSPLPLLIGALAQSMQTADTMSSSAETNEPLIWTVESASAMHANIAETLVLRYFSCLIYLMSRDAIHI